MYLKSIKFPPSTSNGTLVRPPSTLVRTLAILSHTFTYLLSNVQLKTKVFTFSNCFKTLI